MTCTFVHDSRFESTVQMRGEPPLRLEVEEEAHHRGRAELALVYVVAEVGFAPEEAAEIAVVDDILGPVMGEEYCW